MAGPECRSPMRAWPKSQMVSGPKPPSMYCDTYVTVPSLFCFRGPGLWTASSSTPARMDSIASVKVSSC